MEFLAFVVFGLIVGVIAKFLMPGRDPGGFVVTAVLGMAGSFVGGYVARMMGVGGGSRSAGWIMSVVGAIVVLAIYRVVAGRRLRG